MMRESKHLQAIMEKHHRVANMQVVFLDIEKYSQRRTLNQIETIDSFTQSIRSSLSSISKEYVEYAQKNGLNFQEDIITIPTGDGAAIIFMFEGLHTVHLSFALAVLKDIYEKRQKESCEKFSAHGWCNCHPYLNLRIGISEGKGIVYRDIKNDFNVAGNAVNMAARAMALAGRSQIIFTQEAFTQIVDLVDDATMVDRFVEFKDVEIKHGKKITVYQYIDPSCPFLDCSPPEDLVVSQRGDALMQKMKEIGFGFPGLNFDTDNKKETLDKMDNFINKMGEAFKMVDEVRLGLDKKSDVSSKEKQRLE